MPRANWQPKAEQRTRSLSLAEGEGQGGGSLRSGPTPNTQHPTPHIYRLDLATLLMLRATFALTGVALGLIWATAQQDNRADLCHRYRLYCPPASTQESSMTRTPEGFFRIAKGNALGAIGATPQNPGRGSSIPPPRKPQTANRKPEVSS